MTIKTFPLTIIIICCLFAVPALSQNDDAELIRVFTELNQVYGF
jgi:hypothetical protein